MKITALSLDTHGFEQDAPNYGRVSVEIGGRSVSLQLDQAQVDEITALASRFAGSIVAGFSNEQVAA